MWAILAGAVLMIGGLLYLFQGPLSRRSSEPHQSAHGGETLEPPRQAPLSRFVEKLAGTIGRRGASIAFWRIL